jgi:hypothetical protein
MSTGPAARREGTLHEPFATRGLDLEAGNWSVSVILPFVSAASAKSADADVCPGEAEEGPCLN